MVRIPRRFRRPIPATLGLSILLLGVIYGGMEVWPRIQTYQRLNELDRMRRDQSLSSRARAEAAQRMAEFGLDAAAYMPALTHDTDPRVREKAYAYLSSTEPITDEAVELCLGGLRDDVEPRARAMAACGLGPTAFLARADPSDRRQRILNSLKSASRDGSAMVRSAVLQAMINAQAIEFDPGPWLKDPDRSVRLAAAEAIFWLDPKHRDRVIPALRAMVAEAHPERPTEVLRPMSLLYRIDPSICRELVPTFVGWLGHDDPEVRVRVAIWLANLGPLAQAAVPALGAMLATGPPAQRTGAAMAVICVEPSRCAQAAEALVAVLADPIIEPRQRAEAIRPLALLFHNQAVPAGLRETTRTQVRSILDQPGLHPLLGDRIRILLAPPSPSRRGPTARLISTH